MQPTLYKFSLLLAGLSTAVYTLFLFRYLDGLVAEKRVRSPLLRIALGIINGGLTAYFLSLYQGGTPTVFLILFLDALYVAEYQVFIGVDQRKIFGFLGASVYFNNLMTYTLSYSLYRILPLDILDVASIWYQRLTFIEANISLTVLCIIVQTELFPMKEVREVIHSKEPRFLQIWLPVTSTAMTAYSMLVQPLVQTENMNRRLEVGLYAAVFLWALSCIISCWSILLHQANRAKDRNVFQGQLDKEQRRQAKLREQADRQPLTGLYNRRAWEREVKSVLAAGGEGCLVIIDLDHFKEVNDNLGHQEGDRVLKETADMLRQTFRKIDLIGHVGGDEFYVFLVGNPGRTTVEQRLDYLMDLRRQEFPKKDGGTFWVTLSAGYAAVSGGQEGDAEKTFETLARAADTALYWRKEHGRDGYTMWSREMDGTLAGKDKSKKS